jgi:hypothetical protein
MAGSDRHWDYVLQVLDSDSDEDDNEEDDSGSEGRAAEVSLTASSMSHPLAWGYVPFQPCAFALHCACLLQRTYALSGMH